MDQSLVDEAVETINDAIAEYNPVRVYALVSGGNDSTVAAHIAASHGSRLDGIAHINTGIGVEQTRSYVREFSNWLGQPLIEKHPPRTYEDLVMEYGFPGPAAHRYMYSWLKERPLRELRREAQGGHGGRVIFITGVRRSESTRRMGHVQPVQRDGNTVWVAPIVNFTFDDIWAYRAEYDLPTNEVVGILHMSGECLCGAFSKPGELRWLSAFYPDVAERIERLERRTHDSGIKSCHWGPQSSKKIREAPGRLCTGCAFDPATDDSKIVITVGAH
jgi:3'-phosphoadenosine 5'-phosphosulfate sulfotransferase (PAPS reductase)/FAD synthetase